MENVNKEQDKSNMKIINRFAGKKYEITELVGKRIAIVDYKQEESTKHPDTIYYKLQIIIKDSDNNETLGFTTTGAQQIVKVLDTNPVLPIYKTIIKKGKAYRFLENEASDSEILSKIINDLKVDLNKI